MIIIKKIIYYCILFLCIVSFIYSVYGLNKQNKDLDKKIKLNNYYSNINKDSYKYINIIDEYRNKYNNNDIIGILKIDGLGISSLIVQGNDNEYYLNHLENKDSSVYGSLMLDYRTNLNNSKINLIYGHMSKSDATPFTKLDKYLNYDFYKNNKLIEITDENYKYKYEIFSVAKISKNEYRHLTIKFNNDNELLNQYNWFKDISMYKNDISLNSSDNILILQTCTKNSNEFILVIAKLI